MALIILNQEVNNLEGVKKVTFLSCIQILTCSVIIIFKNFSSCQVSLSYFWALQALDVLSRALETDPTSVTLWIFYLLIYYSNTKSVGKDDMFSHAVCYYIFPTLIWSMLWRLGGFCMCGDSPIGVAINVGNSKKTLEICICILFPVC